MIAIAVLITGCKGESPPPPPPPARGLTVLDQGLEPRTPLRYRIAKGTASSIEVTSEVAMGFGGDVLAWPSIVTTSDVACDDVAADGAMKLRYVVRAVTAVDRPNAAVKADQMTPALQDMVGTTLAATLSPAGVLSGVTVETGGKQLPPALLAQVGMLTKNFERMVMPLPERALGVGALWKFDQTLDQTGIQLAATTTIKATAMTPTTLTIVLTSSITGPDQETNVAGPKVKLSKIAGTMRGTGTIDLVALTLTGELLADLQMDMTADNQTEHATMTTALRLAPRPHGAQ